MQKKNRKFTNFWRWNWIITNLQEKWENGFRLIIQSKKQIEEFRVKIEGSYREKRTSDSDSLLIVA